MRSNSALAFSGLILGIILLSGCGEPEATVSGTVKYQGKPLPSGTVTFIGKDNKVGTSSIDSQGRYSIAKAPIGEVTITVSTPPQMPKMPTPAGAPVMPTTETIPIPKKYSTAAESPLKYTVKPGPQEYLIELN
jgi:hypothetical protein